MKKMKTKILRHCPFKYSTFLDTFSLGRLIFFCGIITTAIGGFSMVPFYLVFSECIIGGGGGGVDTPAETVF